MWILEQRYGSFPSVLEQSFVGADMASQFQASPLSAQLCLSHWLQSQPAGPASPHPGLAEVRSSPTMVPLCSGQTELSGVCVCVCCYYGPAGGGGVVNSSLCFLSTCDCVCVCVRACLFNILSTEKTLTGVLKGYPAPILSSKQRDPDPPGPLCHY